MTDPAATTAAALLANSAADMVRLLEDALCEAVPADRRTCRQHSIVHMARRFYNAVVADEIRDAAGLALVAATVARVVNRRPFPAREPGRTDTAERDVV